MLTVITITKDDLTGVLATIASTRKLRELLGARQIVVDSSVAELSEQIKRFASSEANVDYFWQEPAGISAAFNFGISKAGAGWVWFLNGRDEVHPKLSCEWLGSFLDNASSDVAVFQVEMMQSRRVLRHPYLWKMWPPVNSWIPHPATIVQREVFEKYGKFDTSLKISMDFDLWFRIMSKDIVVDTLSVPITLYDEEGVSIVKSSSSYAESKLIIKKHMKTLLYIWWRSGVCIYEAMKFYTKNGK